MATIHNAYINALLADAAYLDLEPGMTGRDLAEELALRMTPTLAAFMGGQFMVVTQASHAGSGFDATVWKEKATGKVFISMRGTAGLADILSDIDLAGSGNARDQLTDMVNWWLRETTAAGKAARQVRVVYSDLNDPPWGFEESQPVSGTGGIPAADLVRGIEVNGHSLGGYLASAFTRLFDAHAHITHTSTFNGAGFAPGSEAIFKQLEHLIGIGYGLGRFPNGAEQSNYFAAHGINVTTNGFWFSQVGQRVRLFNEEGTGLPNHYMYKLTDALALGDALSLLDPTLGFERMNAIFELGANSKDASLEKILDGVRKTLVESQPTDTPVSDAAESQSRKTFHANLKALQESPAVKALSGRLQVTDAVLDGLAAKDDFGALLSLVHLTTFVLKPVDSAASAVLQSAQPILSNKWLEDRNLSADDRDGGKAHFSDAYLADRASMLSWLVKRNLEDEGDGALLVGPDQMFHDLASNTQIKIGLAWTGDEDRRKFLFGDKNANSLLGGEKSDRIYGGDGSDTLNGGNGDDHLEGNAHSDELFGGSGVDQLSGGTGDDHLDGGIGHDFLKGGEGIDTYVLGDGIDTIRDVDRNGRVVSNGVTITGGKNVSGNLQIGGVWEDASSNVTYIYQAEEGAAGALTVRRGAGSVHIKDWKNGDLGITLGETQPLSAPTTSREIDGDFQSHRFKATVTLANFPVPKGEGYATQLNYTLMPASTTNGAWLGGRDYVNGNFTKEAQAELDQQALLSRGLIPDRAHWYSIVFVHERASATNTPTVDIEYQLFDDLGNSVAGAGIPSDWDDSMHGDELYGSGGNDRINAGRGNDWVQAGDGHDIVIGGSQGGSEGYFDMLNGEIGNDTIFADEAVDLANLRSLSNFGGHMETGSHGDWLYGEHGNDALFGGASNDALFGGAGKDILVGGAGDDIVNGDQMREPHSYEEKVSVDDSGAPFGMTRYQVDISKPGAFIADKLIDVMPNNGGDGDILYGGTGNDRLHGGLGKDYLAGESGDDVITGEEGDDYIAGGEGNDALTGEYNGGTYYDGGKVRSHGNDYIDGGSGNDIMQGEGGSDILHGGSGDDMIWGDAHYYELPADQHGDDLLEGGAGSDQLYGQGGNDILAGGAGDDVLDGGDGDDIYIVNAGDGNDRILDASGKNKIIFGTGVTQESLKLGLGSLLVSYGAAADEIHLEGFDPSNAMDFRLFETFEFADGSVLSFDSLVARGFDIAGTGDIFGTSVSDRIQGSEADDYIYARAGNDAIAGGAGADYMEGMEGDDILIGGSGDDQLIESSGANFLSGGDGNDLLSVSTTSEGRRASFIVGGKGDDYIDSQTLHNVIAFNAGDGADTLYVGNALTLSLGRIYSGSLSLTMDGGDVILNAGDDGIRLLGILSDYDSSTRPSIVLQTIGSAIRTFNFNAVLEMFVSSTASGGPQTSWSIANALEANQITYQSPAIGGNLAYKYAFDGHLESISATTIQTILLDPMFGTF